MSADLRCVSTPISWLRLEQLHAGELGAPARAAIAEHLATCGACAACLSQIENESLAPLPALDVGPRAVVAEATRPPAPTAGPAPSERRGRVHVLARVAPLAATVLAAAAAVLLLVGRRPVASDGPAAHEVEAARTKGGGVGFVLVRDDDGVVAEAGGAYRDGDRWKALVTCPVGMQASWDVVVFEDGDAAFPLAPAAELTCGNDVPLPGAFRTSGHARMTVCLVWDDSALVDRAAMRGLSPDALPRGPDALPRYACKVLDPAP